LAKTALKFKKTTRCKIQLEPLVELSRFEAVFYKINDSFLYSRNLHRALPEKTILNI